MTTTTRKRKARAQAPPNLASQIQEIRALARAEDLASRFRVRLDGHGKPVPPDANYIAALESWLAGYDPKVLPIAQRQMVELSEAYQAVQALDSSGENYLFGQNQFVWARFWNARDKAQAACFRDPPPPIKRKSPTVLFAEKVSLAQIAYEWVWLLENGQPDVQRVQRELDTPGSELTEQAIAERQAFDLQELGFVFTEPPAPDEAQLLDELTNVEEYLASLEIRVEQARQERDRIKAALAGQITEE